MAALTIGLDRTIAALTAARKRVWLIGPIPEIGYPVPRALYLAQFGDVKKADIVPTYDEFKARQRRVFELLSQLRKNTRLGSFGRISAYAMPLIVLSSAAACRYIRMIIT